MLKEVDTFTYITRHYSNAITQFITQFITQIPLLKSLLIITQMPFSSLIITQPLLKGHFADVGRHAGGPSHGLSRPSRRSESRVDSESQRVSEACSSGSGLPAVTMTVPAPAVPGA